MHRLFLVCLFIAIATSCHYSCSTCTGPEYISCLTCPNDSLAIVVQNTSLTPSQYWASVYSTGACVSTTASSANPLGIIIFILVVAICLFFQTKESFYLLLTFQTYGLYNLLETAWVNPIGYVLQGLQYFMIMNTMGFNYKTEDLLLVASKNYRLDSFLGTTNLAQNLAIIAAFTIAALIVLIVIAVIAIRKKKQAEKEHQQELIMGKETGELKQLQEKQQQIVKDEDEQNKGILGCWRTFSEGILIKVAKLLLCLLFLLAQQTCLVLLVSLVYQSPVDKVTIALCIIYLHILVFVMSYCFYYRVQYFKQKRAMYLAFAQKIVLPVMVVVPIKYQFVFFIFAIIFLIMEFVFDYMNGLYRQFSRILIYKGCQMLSVLVLTVYYIVQNSAKTYPSSRAAAIAATFVIALNIFAFFGVQLPFAIKDKFFSNNVSQDIHDKEMEQLHHNDTVDDIHEGKNSKKAAQVEIINYQSNTDEQSNDGKKQDDATLDGNSIVDHPKQPEIDSAHLKLAKKEPEPVPEPQPVAPPPPKKRRKQIIDPQLRMRYGI